jgi:glycolate oxidase iron-sulfur subunit
LNHPDLVTDTDLCVKCGLCLPHCPTYAKTQDENESPRGRLSLIQGWAQGSLAATPELTRHVDNCLLCRSCESVCPAYVPYGRIVDHFRQATAGAGKPLSARLKTTALRQGLSGAWGAPLARKLMAGKAAGSIRKLAGVFGQGDLVSGLPETSSAKDWTGVHPAQGKREIARVSLFLGCTANLLDTETVASAIRLMTRLGVTVRVPEGQVCCGALHWHGGKTAATLERMESNLKAFGGAEGEAIVGFASGCGAMLRDYGEIRPSDETARFSKRIRDIGQFLAELPWPDDLELWPLSATASLHSPCSLRNVLKADLHAGVLLRRIPGLNTVPLPTQIRCCGAAGSYMLEHPEMAGALRDDALDAVLAAEPRFLLTSNPGCAMHLRAGLKQRGRGDIEVLHPVTLLARQLPQ